MMTRSKSTKKSNNPKNSKEEAPEMQTKLNNLEIQNIALTEKVEDIQSEFEKALNEKQDLKRTKIELSKQIEKLKKQIDVISVKDKNLLNKNNELKTRLEQREKIINREKNDKEDITRRWQELSDKIDDMNSKNELFAEKIAFLKENNIVKDTKTDELKNQFEKTKLRLKKSEDELLSTSKKLNLLETDFLHKEKLRKDKISNSEETIRNLKESLRKTESEISKIQKNNDSLQLDLQNKKEDFESLSNDFKSKTTAQNEEIIKLQLSTATKNRHIELLNSARKNHEQHIESLKQEIALRDSDRKTIQLKLTNSESQCKALSDRLNEIKNQKRADIYLTESIRETTAFLNPDYDYKALLEFNAAPEMSSPELYLKCVKFYDSYKSAFKEKLALENGLKRFSKYLENKSPEFAENQAKFDMLKQSYSNLAKRLALSRQKTVSLQQNVRELTETNKQIDAKKSAYRRCLNVLKSQIQNLLREKFEGKDSEFVFEDFKDLHDKYFSLMKKYNKLAKISRTEKEKLEKKSESLINEVSEMREQYQSENVKMRNEIKLLTEKYGSFTKKAVENSSSAPIGQMISQTNNLRYEKLVQETNESIKSMQKDHLEAISKAETKCRELELKSAKDSLHLAKAESAFSHEKRMCKLVGDELSRAKTQADKALEAVSEEIKRTTEANEKINRLEIVVEKKKEEVKELIAKIEYQRGATNALKQSENHAMEKLSQTKELIAIQNTKIERLELTNKLLSENEKKEYDKSLSEKATLEKNWEELRQSRELDLKASRDALDNTNSLAKKAMDQLKLERIAVKEAQTTINGLRQAKQTFEKRLERANEKIENLEKFKRSAQKLQMEIKGNTNDTSTKIITAEKIVMYERELEDLKVQRQNFEQMYISTRDSLQKTAEKMQRIESESAAEIKKANERADKNTTRLYKVTHELQKALFRNTKMHQEQTEFETKRQSLEMKIQNMAKERSELKKSFEKQIESLRHNETKKLSEIGEIQKKYEAEVQRHGTTIGKLDFIQKTAQKAFKHEQNYKTAAQSAGKRLKELTNLKEITSEECKNLKASHEEAIKDLKKQILLLTDELTNTNSLNRYLRRINKVETNLHAETSDETKSKLEKSVKNYQSILSAVHKEKNIGEKRLENIKIQLEKAEQTADIRQTEIKALQGELKKSMESLANVSKNPVDMEKFKKATQQVVILTENNNSLRTKLNESHKIEMAFEDEISSLKAKTIPLQEKLESLQSQLNQAKDLAKRKEKLSVEWEQRCLKIFDQNNYIDPDEHERLKNELRDEKNSITKLTKEVEYLRSTVENLKKNKTEIESELKEAQTALEKYGGQDFDSLIKERNELASKLRDFNFETMTQLEKHELIVSKMDHMMREEKETSEIFKRNAQNANLLVKSKTAELSKMTKDYENANKKLQTREKRLTVNYSEKIEDQNKEKRSEGENQKDKRKKSDLKIIEKIPAESKKIKLLSQKLPMLSKSHLKTVENFLTADKPAAAAVNKTTPSDNFDRWIKTENVNQIKQEKKFISIEKSIKSENKSVGFTEQKQWKKMTISKDEKEKDEKNKILTDLKTKILKMNKDPQTFPKPKTSIFNDNIQNKKENKKDSCFYIEDKTKNKTFPTNMSDFIYIDEKTIAEETVVSNPMRISFTDFEAFENNKTKKDNSSESLGLKSRQEENLSKQILPSDNSLKRESKTSVEENKIAEKERKTADLNIKMKFPNKRSPEMRMFGFQSKNPKIDLNSNSPWIVNENKPFSGITSIKDMFHFKIPTNKKEPVEIITEKIESSAMEFKKPDRVLKRNPHDLKEIQQNNMNNEKLISGQKQKQSQINEKTDAENDKGLNMNEKDIEVDEKNQGDHDKQSEK